MCVSPGEVGKARPGVVALSVVSCSKMNLRTHLWFMGKNKPIPTPSQNNNICAAPIITTGTCPPFWLAGSDLRLALSHSQGLCSLLSIKLMLLGSQQIPAHSGLASSRKSSQMAHVSTLDTTQHLRMDAITLLFSSFDLCDEGLCGSPSTPVTEP